MSYRGWQKENQEGTSLNIQHFDSLLRNNVPKAAGSKHHQAWEALTQLITKGLTDLGSI